MIDWRDMIASALAEHPFPGDYDAVPVREIFPEPRGRYIFLARRYREQADAVLDRIKAAGYRLHREHDFQPDLQRVGLHPGEKCVRCGAIRDGILALGSCEPREGPQG